MRYVVSAVVLSLALGLSACSKKQETAAPAETTSEDAAADAAANAAMDMNNASEEPAAPAKK
jgi:hypothetical protein